jgi:4-hydroxybenzoate polyprenyltransferase
MLLRNKLPQYIYLMRLNKPIGILLLLWPALWALWLASSGFPDKKILFIFIAGVILMRSAGCIFNDFADRKFDLHVSRTRERPLASGKVKPYEALLLAGFIALLAFLLVLYCNQLTISLACIGALLTMIYPFLKRMTHLPQLGLGAAFAFSIPMAFAAVTEHISFEAWWLFAAALIWPVIYDTMYAMVDRFDDMKIGVKSTAILFAQKDKWMIAILQILFLIMMIITGKLFQLNWIYYCSLFGAGLLFLYQQFLIKDRDPQACFKAFLNNNWVGLLIFCGIVLA